MAFFTDIIDRIGALRDLVGDIDAASALPSTIEALEGEAVLSLLRQATDIIKTIEQVSLVSAGVISRRSRRDAGHAGLAQSHGHSTSTSLIQDISGTSKADAARQSRVGESLLDAETPAVDLEQSSREDPDAPPTRAAHRWDDPLRDAMFRRSITSQQHDAIRRGLGEPPAPEGAAEAVILGFAEAWTIAAEQLVVEAEHRTLEELRAAARTIRDQLDPDGAEARFLERHAARSFRMWTDQDGRHHASAVLDDEGFLWLKTVMDAALRPRRGGPRFVDSEEQVRAAELADDPRTNDQLAYDLIMDVLRAGTMADVETVFGARQAGVRLVQHVDAIGNPQGPALSEDGLLALPADAAARRICDTGSVAVAVDGCGNPLDVGREHRLFTPRQRIALAIRDGGCRWKGCDRPASYCEAHHIDPYSEGGRTDIDRGILLCRFHHMELHHGQWRILRDGTNEFRLRHRSGEEHELRARAVLAYAWAGIDPPPKRFRPVAA